MKNKSISLRLNDDDKEFLKQQAKAHNLSLSRYVREVVTNTYKNE
jgi:predicted DNA binding CopG/RHH family protein